MSPEEKLRLTHIAEVVLTTIVGPIFVALVTRYLPPVGAAKEKATAPTEHLRVLQFEDPSVKIRSWNIRRVKWLLPLPSILAALTTLMIGGGSTFITIFQIAIVVLTFGVVALIRNEAPSRTIKTAEFKVDGNQEQILRDCLAAVQQTGASVGQYDSLKGVIEARTKMSWKSYGEIIKIEVTKTSGNEISLRITSDTVTPSTLLDWGANARNIRRIKTHLLR